MVPGDLTEHHRFALRNAVIAVMEQASEKCYCAGWMMGTAMKHYAVAYREDKLEWGLFAISNIRPLTDMLGEFPTDDDRWVSLEEAAAIFDKWQELCSK